MIFGDSVGNQLFDNRTDGETYVSICSNQAISLAGQYALLSAYLKNNPQTEEVCLLYVPVSFQNNLDQRFTYQYFLKPFGDGCHDLHWNATVQHQIDEMPFGFADQWAVVKASDWSPNLSHQSVPESDTAYFSAISLHYLQKMADLTDAAGVDFKVQAGFVKKAFKQTNYHTMHAQLRAAGLQGLFATYFQELNYLPDPLFKDDLHVIDPDDLRDLFYPFGKHSPIPF